MSPTLKEVTLSLKTKLTTAYQTYKDNYTSSSQEEDTRCHSLSDDTTPREASPPKDQHYDNYEEDDATVLKGSKVMEAVIQTLFGACTGTNCTADAGGCNPLSSTDDQSHVRNMVSQLSSRHHRSQGGISNPSRKQA